MPRSLQGYDGFARRLKTTGGFSRRYWLCTIVWLIGAPVLRLGAAARADNAPTLSDAVGVLERERSAAEQEAKAEFDGLIAQLRLDLINGSNPTQSPKFAAEQQGAAEKRIAFTNFVSDQVVGKAEGARPRLMDVVKVVPDLVKALTDAGLGIWGVFHTANKEHREAILSEIGHLRWRAFADLAPKPN